MPSIGRFSMRRPSLNRCWFAPIFGCSNTISTFPRTSRKSDLPSGARILALCDELARHSSQPNALTRIFLSREQAAEARGQRLNDVAVSKRGLSGHHEATLGAREVTAMRDRDLELPDLRAAARVSKDGSTIHSVGSCVALWAMDPGGVVTMRAAGARGSRRLSHSPGQSGKPCASRPSVDQGGHRTRVADAVLRQRVEQVAPGRPGVAIGDLTPFDVAAAGG